MTVRLQRSLGCHTRWRMRGREIPPSPPTTVCSVSFPCFSFSSRWDDHRSIGCITATVGQ
jgi:hypothetical protein